MRNYQIWNKHGDDSEKEPTEILMDTVKETIHYPITEVILVTMQEIGKEAMKPYGKYYLLMMW